MPKILQRISLVSYLLVFYNSSPRWWWIEIVKP